MYGFYINFISVFLLTIKQLQTYTLKLVLWYVYYYEIKSLCKAVLLESNFNTKLELE